MEASRYGSHLWTLRKWGISAFICAHIGATLVWTLPNCPIRVACLPAARYYILPLGLWQFWGMFAPDPVRDTYTLEADVVDARGMRSTFYFTRLADFSRIGGIPRFRHSKYAANLGFQELSIDRTIAARHAVRKLGIPADAFPVDINLMYQLKVTPLPGGPPADPMTPPQPVIIGTQHFDTIAEVRG